MKVVAGSATDDQIPSNGTRKYVLRMRCVVVRVGVTSAVTAHLGRQVGTVEEAKAELCMHARERSEVIYAFPHARHQAFCVCLPTTSVLDAAHERISRRLRAGAQ